MFPRIHVHWHQQQGAKRATFREPEYNVPPLLTDGTWQLSCMIFRWVRKHKLGRGHPDLASCQVSLHSVWQFQRRSKKCLSQSEASVAILVLWSARQTQIGRGPWDLAACQVLLLSVQHFQRRSRKCLSQSEARAAILVFQSLIQPAKHKLGLSFLSSSVLHSNFRGEVENVKSKRRQMNNAWSQYMKCTRALGSGALTRECDRQTMDKWSLSGA